jgi:hypothetical protein
LVGDLVEAGFVDVSVSAKAVPFEVGSAAEFVSFTRAVTPPSLRRLLTAHLEPQDEQAVWSAVGEAAAALPGGGRRLTSTAWCLRAVAPADGPSERSADG